MSHTPASIGSSGSAFTSTSARKRHEDLTFPLKDEIAAAEEAAVQAQKEFLDDVLKDLRKIAAELDEDKWMYEDPLPS
eukprot:tig00000718_g3722.t1